MAKLLFSIKQKEEEHKVYTVCVYIYISTVAL